MVDHKTPSSLPHWHKPVKSRNWKAEEVEQAIKQLKEQRPKEWAEVERLELTSGDLRESEAAGLIFGRLANLHPECEPGEISDLEWAIRLVRRAALGLK